MENLFTKLLAALGYTPQDTLYIAVAPPKKPGSKKATLTIAVEDSLKGLREEVKKQNLTTARYYRLEGTRCLSIHANGVTRGDAPADEAKALLRAFSMSLPNFSMTEEAK